MKRSTLFLIAALAAAQAQAAFSPVLVAGLNGGYAATTGQNGSFLGLLDLNAVPAWSQGRFSLLPAFTASAGGQERSIEEGTLFVRSYAAAAQPTVGWQLEKGRSVEARLSALHSWNIETLDESFGKGLYDYEQYGGGLGYRHPLDSLWALKAGFDVAHRSYPNDRNLPAAAALNQDKGYYLKDFDAVSFDLALVSKANDFSLAYHLERRDHGDAFVVRTDGQLDLTQHQVDWLHDLKASSPLFVFGRGGLLKGSLGLQANASNQGFFDLAAPVPTFVPNYTDYIGESFGLSLLLDGGKLHRGLRLTPGWDLALVQTQKPVQQADASYTDAKQSSMDNTLRLSVEQALAGGLSLSWSSLYRISRSNQVLVRGPLNDYEYWQTTVGLRYVLR